MQFNPDKEPSTDEVQSKKKLKESMGTRFFAPVLTGPGAHPTSCTMGIGFPFRGVKQFL